MAEFSRRYRRYGSPLAQRGAHNNDVPSADFTDWTLQLHPDVMKLLRNQEEGMRKIAVKDLEKMMSSSFFCCPEDQRCSRGCVEQKRLCPHCAVPVCRSCRKLLHENVIIPEGLINDNWYGYLEPWIYQQEVTWMEKTVASPYWTGIQLFTVGTRGKMRKAQRRHLMEDAMYSCSQRVAFKGQVFSAPMDWRFCWSKYTKWKTRPESWISPSQEKSCKKELK